MGGGSERRTFKTWRCCHTRCEMTRRLGEWGEGRVAEADFQDLEMLPYKV